MEISIHVGLKDTDKMSGVAVVIDVFRATTTIACLLQSQADKILVLPDANDIKKYCFNENYACFSEVVEEGYDNSPIIALSTELKAKTAVISTTNGTKGILAARKCKKVLTAAFINLDAIVDYLIALEPPKISLIAVGHITRNAGTIEDTLCAQVIKNRLEGLTIDESQIRKILMRRILDRRLDLNKQEELRVYNDMLLCSTTGILNVIPKVTFKDDQIVIADAFKRSI